MSSQNFTMREFPLGNVKVGESYPVVFPKTEHCRQITKYAASCGCTDVSNMDDKIYAIYHAKPIAPELGDVVSLPITKSIEIEFDDNSKETLLITGTLFRE